MENAASLPFPWCPRGCGEGADDSLKCEGKEHKAVAWDWLLKAASRGDSLPQSRKMQRLRSPSVESTISMKNLAATQSSLCPWQIRKFYGIWKFYGSSLTGGSRAFYPNGWHTVSRIKPKHCFLSLVQLDFTGKKTSLAWPSTEFLYFRLRTLPDRFPSEISRICPQLSDTEFNEFNMEMLKYRNCGIWVCAIPTLNWVSDTCLYLTWTDYGTYEAMWNISLSLFIFLCLSCLTRAAS